MPENNWTCSLQSYLADYSRKVPQFIASVAAPFDVGGQVVILDQGGTDAKSL